MRCSSVWTLILVVITGLVVPAVYGEEPPTLLEALTKGSPVLSLRYRYENVSDDAVGEKEAHASTLRTVVGYKTLSWRGLGFYIAAENVTTIGNDLYNNIGWGDLNNGVTDRPVVADPAITDISEAYFWFDKGGTNLQLGREQINIDDQRFIGAVAWRQHHQSFNAFKFTNNSLDWARFLYSYLDKVHRINGATWDTASHLFNVRFKLGEVGTLTPYVYLLDFDNPSQFGISSASYGLEFIGHYEFDADTALNYEVEYASQSDYGNNPNRLRADYLFLMLQGVFKPLSVLVGYEVLGGSVEDGQFSTPLATLHKFNGWADMFLTTPTNGLEDLFLQLHGKIGPVKWMTKYHFFSAADVSSNYGDELDLQVAYVAPWKQTFAFTAGLYGADEFRADTNKFWIWTTFKI